MNGNARTAYEHLADVVEQLPMLVRDRRRVGELTLRAAAAEAGISFSTLARLERGHPVNSNNLLAVLRWLDSDLGPLL